MTHDRPPLARGGFDRDARTRLQPHLLEAAWREPGARLLRLRGAEIPVMRDSARPRLSLLEIERREPSEPSERADHADRPQRLFLGRLDGAPVFATADDPGPASGPATAASEARPSAEGQEEEWRHPFEVASDFSEAERELVAVASGLLRWHEQSSHSAFDGSPTEPEQGGWMRRDSRGVEHFPRTDPAVIVLIEHDDRILLGSNALWETGRFSLLAGFVETGESLEQAVEREVFEESGVRLDDLRYVASQPWPFPRSLMLGFRARLAADSDPEHLVPDPDEISELRWFSRDELRHPLPGITLPMPLSIARWMIDRWVAETPEGSGGTRGGGGHDG